MINKIKKHGLVGSVRILYQKISDCFNKVFFNIFKLLPINGNLILLESEGDLTDNAYALYDYMNSIDLLNKYKVVWLVDNVKEARKRLFKNTKCVFKFPKNICVLRAYYLATCRWFIYDHCNVFADLHKRDKQLITYLSHGWGYKASKGSGSSRYLTHPDKLIATGKLSAKGLAEYWNEPIDNVAILGYPRIDFFFKENLQVSDLILNKLEYDRYKKIIFWMPTFRQSNSKEISEEYIDNQTGLPIFETYDSLKKFSEYLNKNNVLLVFKLHHLQADLDVFHKKFDNILILRDEDLSSDGVQLYQVVKYADIIISDYSSISIDAMVLDIPLIYTLDDYKKYDESRGLFPHNAIDYMPGYHIYDDGELMGAVSEILEGKDKYSEERNNMRKLYHKFDDGDSSKRVVDLLKIK